MIFVTKPDKVHCPRCSGSGWIPKYHNEMEECPHCAGEKVVMGNVKLTLEELCEKVDEKLLGETVMPSHYIEMMDVYDRWRKA
jgi:hypothetical protein